MAGRRFHQLSSVFAGDCNCISFTRRLYTSASTQNCTRSLRLKWRPAKCCVIPVQDDRIVCQELMMHLYRSNIRRSFHANTDRSTHLVSITSRCAQICTHQTVVSGEIRFPDDENPSSFNLVFASSSSENLCYIPFWCHCVSSRKQIVTSEKVPVERVFHSCSSFDIYQPVLPLTKPSLTNGTVFIFPSSD